MFQQMADGHVATSRKAPERVLEQLREMGADLRECAVIGADGEVLAATADAEWARRAGELWSAADEGEGADPLQLHVATDSGEVFAVRTADGGSVVAVTARFALESLMFCDLRAALRELDPGAEAAS
jgi:hypothetical protein